jgi:hypothetical protein
MPSLTDIIKRLVGTPKEQVDKNDKEKAPVQAPEFDITQYAKKLGVVVGVLFPVVLGALKAAKVGITPGIVEASLGVTAAGLLGVALASAADILGRVYAHRSVCWAPSKPDGTTSQLGPSGLLGTVWLTANDGPHPVLAIERDGHQTLYLILRGSTSSKKVAGKEIDVYDSGPTWISQDQVIAFAAGEAR